MDSIKEIISKENPSFDDLLVCLERIKEKGNSIVIKLDGEREKAQYTVFITFPMNQEKEMIRIDDISLKVALLRCLQSYLVNI